MKTWDEWKKKGRSVIIGEKAQWVDGVALFDECQTVQSYFPKKRTCGPQCINTPKTKERTDVDEALKTIAMVNVVGEEYAGQYDNDRRTLRDAGYTNGEISRYSTYP